MGCCAQSRALPVPVPSLGSRVNAGLMAQLPPRPQGQDLPVPMPLCWLCRNFISRLEASIPKVPGDGWDAKRGGDAESGVTPKC